MATPKYEVPPITAAPPRVSLLTSALVPEVAGTHWLGGIRMRDEACADAVSILDWCSGTDVDEGSSANTTTDYQPYALIVGESCASGLPADDYIGRARRRLAALEARIVEAELMHGQLTQAAGTGNPYLSDGSAIDLGTATPECAFAAITEAAAEQYTTRVMIHARIGIVQEWARYGLVRREGAVLLDILDNIVVAGAGYSGDIVYATPHVAVLREPDIAITPSSHGEAINRQTNVVTYQASRVAAAWWGSCAPLSIEVDGCTVAS